MAQKAKTLGYHSQVILSVRRVNDEMDTFIAAKTIKLMIKKDLHIKGSNVLILEVTFKENCPDIRNTKVVDIYKELQEFGTDVDIYDPWANAEEVKHEYGLDIIAEVDESVDYETIIVGVAHKEFTTFDFADCKQNGVVIFDTKAILDRDLVDERL